MSKEEILKKGCDLLYKNGYFNQKINGNGDQETEYNNIYNDKS